MEPTVVVENFESEILRGNPLGDPHSRRVPVYLPPRYHESNQRYPSVYMLAGFTGRGMTHLNDAAWDEPLPARLDRLIGERRMRPMIVIMPDCFTKYGGSQYINSSATGRYEDHVIDELVPFIDKTYRTLPDRENRVVMGKSSGGYGAMVLGMRHPDVFGLVADHSGDKYFEYCYRSDFPKCLNALLTYGGAEKYMADFPHALPRPSRWFEVIETLAMAACYSPNPRAPLGFDLPFNEQTGRMRPEIWARWLEQDPVTLLDKHAEALRSLRLLYLDCGTRDEYHIHWGNRVFVDRLKQLGIAHQNEEFDDGHRNVQYRYNRSFPLISEALPQ